MNRKNNREFFMQKNTKIKIEDEEIEITEEMVLFYKKQTHKVRVTKKGIEKFFNSLLNKFKNNCLF